MKSGPLYIEQPNTWENGERKKMPKHSNGRGKEIGGLVREIAVRQHLTLSNLARIARVDRSMIHLLCNTNHLPKRETLAKIGDALGYRDELLQKAGYEFRDLPVTVHDRDFAQSNLLTPETRCMVRWLASQSPSVQNYCTHLIVTACNFPK